jgi:hypothetical protein
MTRRTVKLTDPDFYEFPFTFEIGDKALYKGAEVTIGNGLFEGDHPGAYQISYEVRTADGTILQIPQQELVKA